MAQRLVRIIVNPISGRGQNTQFLGELVRHLTLRGFTAELINTVRPLHGRDLARETPEDAHCVVSIGGDGTHREVLSGLIGRPVPACIIPSGTENVLARTFRLTGMLHEVCNTIQHRRFVELDVGMAADHPFIMFSGVGFDAQVTKDVHAKRRGRIHRTAYYGPIARLWWRYGFPPISVKVDGRLLTDDAGMVYVANTPLYGDRMRIAARAVADDGLLDVVCFRARSRWQMLRHFARVKMGRHIGHPLVAYAQAKTIEVTCAERPLPIQIDGDAVAETPLTYTVCPKALRLLVPQEHLQRPANRSHLP